MKTVAIDWVSLTLPWDEVELSSVDDVPSTIRSYLPPTLSGGRVRRVRGMLGYRYGWASSTGWSVLCSEPGDENGVHTIFSGSTLSKLSPEERMQIVELSPNVARLDAAIDLTHNDAGDVSDAWRAWKAGGVLTRARKARYLESTGATVEIGSRTSQRFMRVYDKAAERGVSYPWTRIELECKAAYARKAASIITSSGLSSIPALVADYAQFPLNWYQAAIADAGEIEGTPKLEKRRDTGRWLRQIVALALAREESKHPGTIDEFVKIVNANLQSTELGV